MERIQGRKCAPVENIMHRTMKVSDVTSEAHSIDSLHALQRLFVLNAMMSPCDDACLPGIEQCRASGYLTPVLTCIMRIVSQNTCMNNRQRSLKLPLTLAPPRADSTNQPTHWATPCTGPQPVHWHATVSSRVHVQRLLCAWQVQACVTVRHVRVRVAGGAGAAGAAHATNSVRHARCSDRRPVSGRVF